MSGYTKLFNSILASTVWREADQTRLVWITMMAMSDKHGIVEASLPGLADFARVPLEAAKAAVDALSGPDEYSRSKEHAGRRIEAVDGGWRLLNHAKYRAKLGADERREYLKLKAREYRSKKRRQSTTNIDNVSYKSTLSTHTEAEADTDPEAKNTKERVCVSGATHLSEKPTDELGRRAGRFIERYTALYPLHRNGAHFHPKPALDFQTACELCRTWPDDRLEKLAIVFLKSNHEFAENGSRSLRQFAALASWCDDRLATIEKERGRASQ